MFSIPRLNFVAPVFRATASRRPEHSGSAVLLRSYESYWLVTAAHVAARDPGENIFLPAANGGFFVLQGNPVSSAPLRHQDAQKTNHADLCAFALDDREARALGAAGLGFIGLHPDSVDIPAEIPERSEGVAWGFPAPSITVANGQVRWGAAYLHDFPFAGETRLRRANFNLRQNFALVKPRKLSRDGVRRHEFEINGLSGGAILRSDDDGPRLVGILTEFHGTTSLLVGSRLGDLFASIAEHLSERAPILKPMTEPLIHPGALSVRQAIAQCGWTLPP